MADVSSLDVRLYVKRRPLLRLDVGPFAVAYGALHGAAWAAPSPPVAALVAIPVVLTLHLFVFLSTRWSVACRCLVAYRRVDGADAATHALATPADAKFRELVALARDAARGGAHFSFQRRVFVADGGAWAPLAPITDGPLAGYCGARGLETEAAAEAARRRWGPNAFDIPDPTFGELFEEHYLAPFFVFQVFCCALWSLDEYWLYSCVTLCMLLLFEATLCFQRLRSLEHLRAMRRPPRLVYALRLGAWRPCLSDDLAPGDVCSLAAPSRSRPARGGVGTGGATIPCDCLLLDGAAVVNEAMLTGESVPQRKEGAALADRDATGALAGALLVDTAHRRHVLFGGTDLIDATPGAPAPQPVVDDGRDLDDDDLPLGMTVREPARAAPPDRGIVVVVLRTGFETAQGQLMRTILFATERVLGSSETGRFIGTLLVFAVCASAYVLREGLRDPDRNRFKLCLHCVLIVTSVVPPELPMELSLAVTNSLAALAKSAVYCTEPFRIAFAGALDVCCFDKTGTLTSDELAVRGVACEPLDALALAKARDVDADCAVVLAASLRWAGPWRRRTSSRPAAPREKKSGDRGPPPPGPKTPLRVLHRYGFASELRRMSCVVAPASPRNDDGATVVCKGAPEALRPLLAVVPAGFDAAYEAHAAAGHRVLALASRPADDGDAAKHARMSPATWRRVPRATAERGLAFRGFLCLQSPLKPGTAQVIDHLKASSHACVITGDNVLTAAHVARAVHIADAAKEALVLETTDAGGVVWRRLGGGGDTRAFDAAAVPALAADYDLFCRGDAVDAAEAAGCLGPVALHCATTLMCGDGTNDVGALKRAHVGVSIMNSPVLEKSLAKQETKRLKRGDAGVAGMRRALADAELDAMDDDPTLVNLGDASIASPFTSKRATIECVLAIVCQGRCTLVSMIQIFKILALMCLVSAYMLSSLYLHGVKQGDSQMTCVGLLTAGLFFLCSRPLETLSAARPPLRVFSPRPAASIAAQFAVHLFALVKAVELCAPHEPRERHAPDGAFSPSTINSAVFLLTAVVQLNTFAANYTGEPFMESLRDHVALSRLLAAVDVLLFAAAAGAAPFLGSWLQLADWPDARFRDDFLKLLAADTLAVGALAFAL
ncbi:calcium-transporting ATPase [Aureococcus anophagefferens]|nr:calcium-transporting ATPase [Aureococcus anophagefferens]